jgi:hypothetical protein
VVDAGDLPDGETVGRAVHDLDGVAGGDLAIGEDAQVGAGPAGGREAPRENRWLPMRMPSLKQGTRGPETSSSTPPARQRSPTTAPLMSRPRVVRFSPKPPGSTSRRSCSAHQSASSPA